jgi:hypothetical protein
MLYTLAELRERYERAKALFPALLKLSGCEFTSGNEGEPPNASGAGLVRRE